MKDTLLQHNIEQVTNKEIIADKITKSEESIWFWVAVVELTVIAFLLIKLAKKKSGLKFNDLSRDKMKGAKNSDIDMDNLMNSINGSKDLYKKLSRSCHPDRFVNSDKQKVAEELFQEISKYKRDYNKLKELKERALNELEIEIKN